MRRAPAARAAALVLTALASAAAVRAQSVTYTGSVQFASGTYLFTDTTRSLLVVNALEVAAGPVRASVTVPFAVQSTTLVTPGGTVIVPTGGSQRAVVGRSLRGRRGGGQIVLPVPGATGWTSGMADPVARVDVSLTRPSAQAMSVSIGGAFKAPVAAVDTGLGTGQWDYGAGVAISRPIRRTLVMLDLFYWKLGDMADLPLENPLAYSLGVGQLLGRGRFSVMATLSGSTKVLDGAEASRSVGVTVSYLTGGRGLVLGAAVGLTETAPDYLVSIGWRIGRSR